MEYAYRTAREGKQEWSDRRSEQGEEGEQSREDGGAIWSGGGRSDASTLVRGDGLGKEE